ncbi:hypothetical protein ANAPC5_01400 [Anaplasma phagocytophilum]|nr:hypothetical protein ANAPC5_01400 [Anaplasma phagocytophilum]
MLCEPAFRRSNLTTLQYHWLRGDNQIYGTRHYPPLFELSISDIFCFLSFSVTWVTYLVWWTKKILKHFNLQNMRENIGEAKQECVTITQFSLTPSSGVERSNDVSPHTRSDDIQDGCALVEKVYIELFQ